nr:rcc1 repeat-containing protein c10f6.04 [Quercus suber]
MLYACGSNGCGQLGLGHTDDTSNPSHVQVHDESSITQIAAGGNHILVLFDNGDVYTCGKGSAEQATPAMDTLNAQAHTLRKASLPREADDETFDKVTQVAATWCASTYLYSSGVLVSAGEGTSGELGLGAKVTNTSRPAIVEASLPQNTKFIQIASCMAHTVAVTSDGQVWGWGKGRNGQLGEPAQNVWQPRKIEGIPFPVVKAVCGKDFTCFIGSKPTGELLVFGPNRNDRFGVKEYAPKFVPGWTDIAASWGSVYILKENGDVVAWGRNDHGQLPSADLPALEALAAGSEHCLALTKAGEILAWGWGEHGNCGELTDQNGDVKTRFNRFAVSGGPIAVFAGCATSFIVTSDSEQEVDRIELRH